jgi:ataxia telangiectasia mutated family protein
VCFRETTAIAACVFKMSKTAILFAEIHHIHTKAEVPPELLLEVYKNVDDPDSPYDVKQDFNLRTVLYNFAYEGNVRMSEPRRVLISSPSG